MVLLQKTFYLKCIANHAARQLLYKNNAALVPKSIKKSGAAFLPFFFFDFFYFIY